MSYSEILIVVLPTFITIFIGYIIGRTVKNNIDGIIDIVFYIGLPALCFTSIMNKQIVLLEAGKIWASAILVSAGCGFMGWVLFKILRKNYVSLYLPISLPNTVNIPFPIISLAYGPTGLLAATLYYIPNTLLMYSIGVLITAGKSFRENLKTMLKVPTIYMAILALIFNFFEVQVPLLIMKTLDFIGMMVVPLVLLTLGFKIAQLKVTSVSITLWSSLIRLGGGLAIGLLVVTIFHVTGIFRSVIVLMSAMPAAVNTYTIAAKFKNESELVGSVVMVTTIASLILIPFLLRVLG